MANPEWMFKQIYNSKYTTIPHYLKSMDVHNSKAQSHNSSLKKNDHWNEWSIKLCICNKPDTIKNQLLKSG